MEKSKSQKKKMIEIFLTQAELNFIEFYNYYMEKELKENGYLRSIK